MSPGEVIGDPLAESALLGALMIGAPVEAKLVAMLTADDFTDPRGGVAYAAVAALVADGIHPDPAAVDGRLRRDGALGCFSNSSAAVWLLGLVELPIVAVSAGHYARTVVEHTWRRRVAEAGQRLTQAAGTESVDGLDHLIEREYAAVRAAAGRLSRLTHPHLHPVRETA